MHDNALDARALDRDNAVDQLLVHARQLDAIQLATLARATNTAVGYLGLRRAWGSSMRSAREAGRAAGRSEQLRLVAERSEEAVLEATLADADADGRNTTAVRDAFHSVRVAFASPSWTQKQKLKTIRGLRRQIRKGLGSEREKRFSVASIGVAGAVTALMTCDLIDDSGPYTRSRNAVLTAPWRAVAELPPID